MRTINKVWNRLTIKREFDAAAFDFTFFGFSLGVVATQLWITF